MTHANAGRGQNSAGPPTHSTVTRVEAEAAGTANRSSSGRTRQCQPTTTSTPPGRRVNSAGFRVRTSPSTLNSLSVSTVM